ncbi:hypothetical protein [Mesorhizobium sp. KR2-14]|uniref:hypothetical protein n=1 Tax=Mesorhizobium sp. KR2-14 TaxID=3156610 RepID=UPI0032B3E741
MRLHYVLLRAPPSEIIVSPFRWVAGTYWDWDLIGFDLGPIGAECSLGSDRLERFCRSWRIFRIVFRPLKLDIRLEVDSNCWLIGYDMAAPWDHGLYLGPINLQVEYNVRYAEDY